MPELRDRILHPRAGWLSIGLLGVMATSLAWSVQGAAWLDQLGFLVPVAIVAVLTGVLLGMLRPNIVVALPLAAVIGAGIVLWTVGGEYFPEARRADRLLVLHQHAISWLRDLVQTGYTAELTVYAAGLGVLLFTTAFTAAHAVYRHNRVLDAIVLLGVVMVANMSATYTDLFGLLIVFVVAALLLWLLGTLADRREGWQRRRVSETVEVTPAIMRSGVIFAAGSVALAWALTSVAVAAPLSSAWQGLDDTWISVRDSFEGAFSSLTNPHSRIGGTTFGPTFTVSGAWFAQDDEALVLAADRPLYLRAATYDHYTGRGWARSDSTRREVPDSEVLFNRPTSERPTVIDSVQVERIAIEMRQAIGRNVFTAGSPLRIYAPTIVVEPDGLPLIGAIEHPDAPDAGDEYQVQAAISVATEAQLGTAGRAYPDEVVALYLDTTGLTDRVSDLVGEITQRAGNDYERVKALANYLRFDPSFTYNTTAPVPSDGEDLVDFFLFDPAANRTGYCEYYASAMVMMVRSLGIPARMATGFAPGERQIDDTYLVRESNAHAWAEVYFPGYGWQIFEATKTISPGFFRASGEAAGPVRPPSTNEDPLLDWDKFRETVDGAGLPPLPLPNESGAPAIGPDAQTPAGSAAADRGRNALVIAAIVFAALVIVWLRMRLTDRRLRLLPAGDRTWQQLTTAANRAGVGQLPSETIYEYAGWLEEQLPRQRDPIRIVADGKVWQAYSGQRLTLNAGKRLETALARLRLPLLWLTIRRSFRRAGGRDRT
ncbi:MAG: transglutaminase domain-containing protein [Chloroflexi bacterium]|nr:transglutaminase domain-containing protein [Chloroflexota bacterium]